MLSAFLKVDFFCTIEKEIDVKARLLASHLLGQLLEITFSSYTNVMALITTDASLCLLVISANLSSKGTSHCLLIK